MEFFLVKIAGPQFVEDNVDGLDKDDTTATVICQRKIDQLSEKHKSLITA